MTEATYHVQLIGSYKDGYGYIDYVFKNLERIEWDTDYLWCVQLPNWDQPPIKWGERGYLTVRDVEAGIDQWFDGKDLHYYNFSMTILQRFRPEPNIVEKEYVLD